MFFKQILINRLSFLILCLAMLAGIYGLSIDPTLRWFWFTAIGILYAMIIYRLTLLHIPRMWIYLLIAALIVPLVLTLFGLDIVRNVFFGHYIPLNNQVLIYALAGLVISAEVYIFCITLFAVFKKVKAPIQAPEMTDAIEKSNSH